MTCIDLRMDICRLMHIFSTRKGISNSIFSTYFAQMYFFIIEMKELLVKSRLYVDTTVFCAFKLSS